MEKAWFGHKEIEWIPYISLNVVIIVFQLRILVVLVLGLTLDWVLPNPVAAGTPPTPTPDSLQGPVAPQSPVPPPEALPAKPAPAAKIGSSSYTVAQGPLAAERQAFHSKIVDLGNRDDSGFGVSGYLKAFESLEQSVKGGAGEEEVQAELKRLSRGLDDQIKRSKLLKIQKPAPPISASGPNPSEMEGASGGGHKRFNGLGLGGQQGQLMDTIKDKWFGGEIPESIKSKIPAGFDPSMLNTPEGQSLLQKLNNR